MIILGQEIDSKIGESVQHCMGKKESILL